MSTNVTLRPRERALTFGNWRLVPLQTSSMQTTLIAGGQQFEDAVHRCEPEANANPLHDGVLLLRDRRTFGVCDHAAA